MASGYIATKLAVGDELDVAAPRGEFVLDEDDEPVVLVSAGIGVTPVLAMLQALAAGRAPGAVWWLHTTSSPATHAFADEARRLLDSLPGARQPRFLHRRRRHGRSAPRRHRGRLDRAALAELKLPTDAAPTFAARPGSWTAMTAALADLGLAPSRIHTETVRVVVGDQPGVVDADRPAPHVPTRAGTGPTVTFARAGITTAFDDGRASLLELAEACDVPTRWSCRTGVCHTCTTPLLSGAVTYSPAPLTEPEAGQVLLCCSRPDSEVVLDL